jgi:hypothetical protein
MRVGITEETYHELERLISDAKPCSRHLLGMSINLQVDGHAQQVTAAGFGVTDEPLQLVIGFFRNAPISRFTRTPRKFFPSAARRMRARRFTLST